ncbi:MAG: ABC transporter ATP-binding protein [Magnetococcales bacterium]|nr:ABC transporter ATP-binding protein [Magnetococcales bacterium]
MKPALTIRNLTKRYGRGLTALSGVNLEIETGGLFAILGPNGAGKSTLINIVSQVVHKGEGEVEIFGVSIDREPQRAKMLLGVTPQEIALDPFFSVRDVLHNHSGYYGIRDNGEWIETLIERLDLAHSAHKSSRMLSGGMKRRLTIAKALVHKPKLLILDEPTAGVDVALRHGLWAFVRELHAQGTTVILTTHYLEEAQELADRVAILQDGQVVACDRTEALLESFGNRWFEILLSDSEATFPLEADCEPSDAGVRISGSFTPEHSKTLFQWLADQAHRVADVRIERASLEDVFLHLTRDRKP